MGLSTLAGKKSTSPQIPSHAYPSKFTALIWGMLAQGIIFRINILRLIRKPLLDSSYSQAILIASTLLDAYYSEY